MKSNNQPTLARLIDISAEVDLGKADPKDARLLLEYFCECIERRKSIPEWMNEHFVKAFRAFLDGSKPIERALGLERKPGRPTADERKGTLLAAAFLRLRLEGRSYQDAQTEVSELLYASPTVVAQAWKEKSEDALGVLRIVKATSSADWSWAEIERLISIYKTKPDFLKRFMGAPANLDTIVDKRQKVAAKSIRKTRREKRSE